MPRPIATPWRSVALLIVCLATKEKRAIMGSMRTLQGIILDMVDFRYKRTLDDDYKCARCRRRMTRKTFTYCATCLRTEKS